MTQPADILAPAIGACFPCRQLFLVTPETPNCILCGQPPAYTLPFSHAPRPLITREEALAHLEAIGHSREAAEGILGPEEPAPAAQEAAEEEEEEEAGDLAVLLTGLEGYFADAGITDDDIATWLMRMGAQREAAATAVGRLTAVRELIRTLRAAEEPALVASAPPEAENPDSPAPTT